MTLVDEIRQQPAVAANLLARAADIARVARAVREQPVDHVVIAARGTSDHAAIYAQYAFGVRLGLPVALATPSVLSLYGASLRFHRALVMGISQSGASPDIVGVVASAREQGVPTIAITNDPGSPLAGAATHLIALDAGPERAVAATKTYTAELLALAMLSASIASGEDARLVDRGLELVPGAIEEALGTDGAAAAAAAELAAHDACVVVGRGYDYATVREWALKLKELAQVVADPYSAADFRHGPVAMVGARFPVLAVVPSGPTADDVATLLRRLRDELRADILVVSDRADLRALGQRSLVLPEGLPAHLVPVVSIVPGQLFARHLAVARGLDPELPRSITKVTRTR
jgi:glutamine---fructose-6-phosphate transaminase (isomerizing)